MTYAVLWSENDGPELTGGLAVAHGRIELTGSASGQPPVQRALACGELRELYFERSEPHRHSWYPALVLVTSGGDRLEIGSLQGLGALHELADEVAAARGKTAA